MQSLRKILDKEKSAKEGKENDDLALDDDGCFNRPNLRHDSSSDIFVIRIIAVKNLTFPVDQV